MELPYGETFEGTVRSVCIKTDIGGFRAEHYDRETGQRLTINRNGLVRVDRTSDARVRTKSGREQTWVGGTETARLSPEEKDRLFEIIGGLFRESGVIERWLDGPYLEVVLTDTDGKKHIFGGWSRIKDDNGFSALLRECTGLRYLEALDGRPEEKCPAPFKAPEKDSIVNGF